MVAPTYHCWFKPSGKAYAILSRTIRDLAHELDGPVFEPHISLVGNLEGTEEELIERTRQLARRLKAFTAVLTEPSYRDTHFQCLFMLVKPTPPLMNAHATASEFFQKAHQEFMAHVSLVYGSYPESRKKLITEHLSADVRTSFEVRDLTLVRADSPDPKDWHEIGTFPLKQVRETLTETR